MSPRCWFGAFRNSLSAYRKLTPTSKPILRAPAPRMPVPTLRSCRAQNVIQSFASREDLLNPGKKLSKGLEKAIIKAKEELGNMDEVNELSRATI